MSAEIESITRNPNGRFTVIVGRGIDEPITVDCCAGDLANYTRLQSKILLATGIHWTDTAIEREEKATKRRAAFDDLVAWAMEEGKLPT